MTYRLLLLASALPLASFGQLQLYLFDGFNETPLGLTYEAGTAALGDTLETRFRVRNMSIAAINLEAITIAGVGFNLAAAPSLPYTLAPGAAADFRTAFNPANPGAFTAKLLVNNLSLTIYATAAAAASLYLGDAPLPLLAGSYINFGSIESGSSRLIGLRLVNTNATAVQVARLTVTGSGFRGPIGLTAPVQLAAGQSSTFQIAFEPLNGQPAQGTLTVDQRTFVLAGQGLNPPLPGASIVFDSQTAASAQQRKLSIALASPSPVSAVGLLTMEFHPDAVGATDDPAIQFLSGSKRVASVSISIGDLVAKVGNAPDIAFQTGTTAGTILFTLKLPNGSQQASVTIAPAVISFDLATGVARLGNLDISLSGFDNTHSASQMAFTFFDRSGRTIPPGQIRVDQATAFRSYFDAGQYGGSFALRATFPVSGDSSQVGGVDVEMTSSAGVAKTQRISF